MDDSTRGAAPAAFAGGTRARGSLVLFFGALAALGPLSMDAYLPAIPSMAEEFGVGIVRLNNTLSVFLLGYALGQFFGGSLSDQVGRKRIGTAGLALYLATTFAIAFASSVEMMQWLRFVQAIGSGFATVICMASIRDVYPVEQLGRKFATLTMVVLVAPLVAPALGSFLLAWGWRAIFLVKSAYALLLFGIYTTVVPETRSGRWRDWSLRALFAQCARVVSRRVGGRLVPIRYAVAMALSVSVLMIFVTNASFLYMQYFQVSADRFPLYFGLSVLGFMSMNLFSMKRLTPVNAAAFFRVGLLIQIAAVALLVLVLVLGAASLATVVPLIVVAMSTLGLVGPAGSARYMGFFEQLAGSASSVYTTMMFSFGGLLGALTGVFYDGTPLPVIAVMLAATAAANLIATSLPAQTARRA
ncbi:MAG TPA: multidrug effflux MFS transporter [Gammaproteobacteria bacterium]